MRINDFHNILELVKQDILQSEAEYLKLLKVVGNNQRYDFRSQLSIYDRNPEATACANLIIGGNALIKPLCEDRKVSLS